MILLWGGPIKNLSLLSLYVTQDVSECPKATTASILETASLVAFQVSCVDPYTPGTKRSED